MQLAALVEKASDGLWTATPMSTLGTIGTGNTKAEALDDLQHEANGLIRYLRERGERLAIPDTEVVVFDLS